MDPFRVIEEVFTRACAASSAGYDPSWMDGCSAAFAAQLGDSDSSLRGVPVLTAAALASGALASGSLVRYTGLVQDQFDPEFYTAVAEVRRADGSSSLRPLAFTSDFDPQAAAPGTSVTLRNDIMERRLVHCG
jgi:hypothetical protein